MPYRRSSRCTHALLQVLESRGVMEKLRAQIRAELFAEIDLGASSPAVGGAPAGQAGVSAASSTPVNECHTSRSRLPVCTVWRQQSLRQPPPAPPRETIILNELFREYLLFNGYEHTLSVFLSETCQPPEPALDRAFLQRELGVTEVESASRCSR